MLDSLLQRQQQQQLHARIHLTTPNNITLPNSLANAAQLQPQLPRHPHPAVGKVSGTFYQIMVDNQPGQLVQAMVHAAALYAACTAISTANTWLTQYLALR
jgi:hypothetical protein